MNDGMLWPVELEARPWGDGTSPEGAVNIVCIEWETVIAKDVEQEIATELCRLWNAEHAAMNSEDKPDDN